MVLLMALVGNFEIIGLGGSGMGEASGFNEGVVQGAIIQELG